VLENPAVISMNRKDSYGTNTFKFFAILLACLPSCLSQEKAKCPLRSSSLDVTCYNQTKPLKGRGNLVKCLAQGHNKRTCRPIFTELHRSASYFVVSLCHTISF